MKNLGKMMQQAQQIQAKMAQMQEDLAQLEVTGASGAGMVQVTLNGKGEARGVKIDPSLLSGALLRLHSKSDWNILNLDDVTLDGRISICE